MRARAVPRTEHEVAPKHKVPPKQEGAQMAAPAPPALPSPGQDCPCPGETAAAWGSTQRSERLVYMGTMGCLSVSEAKLLNTHNRTLSTILYVKKLFSVR